MTRTQLGQKARCAARGKQGAQVMRDMATHYRRMKDEAGFDPTPWPNGG